ncbi:MAG: ATP phosphoribosyltransferase regulatory subunit, partial [Coriobacteriia bacterium]|nr:ATP phosphoribosyltransferase regulatory subunit [Coriobacteriia bacterium]
MLGLHSVGRNHRTRKGSPVNARAPKGTADMLPDTARAWEHLQRVAQDLFARYGYEPVYTPLFEHTEVFT